MACVALAALAAPAFAQDLGRQQSIAVGEAALFPSLRIDYVTDDNIGLRSEDEVDGSAVIVSPRLALVAERRSLELRLRYDGEYSQGSEDALDLVDHELEADLSADFGARRRVDLGLSVQRTHEDLGLELTRGLGDQLDDATKFNRSTADGRFTYGARGARGNLALGLRLIDVSYVNNPSVTDGRDFVRIEPFGQFSYRLSGDTRAVLELSFASISFDEEADDRDELGVSVGADFAATGKLRGGVRVGVAQADYVGDVEDDSTLTFGTNLQWLPREYAIISLALDRAFDNLTPTSTTAGEGQSVRTTARLGWNHAWSDRFSTDAFAQLTSVDRACPELATDVTAGGFEFDVSIRRWLEIGAGIVADSRAADDCPGTGADGLDFERTRLGLHLRATL